MPEPRLRTYAVWDLPTRLFHWINALAVLGLIGIGLVIYNADSLDVSQDGKVLLKTAHVWVGYVFAVNLVWRLVWAFLGNRFARWRAILPGGLGYLHGLRAYAASFLSGEPHPYLGHNPAGRIGVAALLLLLIVQAITGLVLAGTDIYYPPFGYWFAQWVAAPGVDPSTVVPYAPDMVDAAAYESMRDFRAPFIETHEIVFFLVLAVAILHILAVVVTELREGGDITSAMFTGRKVLSHRPEDAPGDGESEGPGRS